MHNRAALCVLPQQEVCGVHVYKLFVLAGLEKSRQTVSKLY